MDVFLKIGGDGVKVTKSGSHRYRTILFVSIFDNLHALFSNRDAGQYAYNSPSAILCEVDGHPGELLSMDCNGKILLDRIADILAPSFEHSYKTSDTTYAHQFRICGCIGKTRVSFYFVVNVVVIGDNEFLCVAHGLTPHACCLCTTPPSLYATVPSIGFSRETTEARRRFDRFQVLLRLQLTSELTSSRPCFMPPHLTQRRQGNRP